MTSSLFSLEEPYSGGHRQAHDRRRSSKRCRNDKGKARPTDGAALRVFRTAACPSCNARLAEYMSTAKDSNFIGKAKVVKAASAADVVCRNSYILWFHELARFS
mmetsp:Transcript_91613/g.163053  ORF Transcript_91613/g.163053 Transcript_91613/m.163053 type:complete len:104 (-) Transcript_91613:886-1197(-)